MVTQIQMVYWKEENLGACNAVLEKTDHFSGINSASRSEPAALLFTDQLL